MIAARDRVVLVVDDSQVQREHLAELMRCLEFGTVLEARDGLEALRVLDAQRGGTVSLVVTDLDMPGMDGIEFIGRLAGHQGVAQLIAISGRDPRLLETVESLAQSTPAPQLLGTLAKPVTREALAGVLQAAARGPRAPVMTPLSLGEIGAGLAAGEFEPFMQPQVGVKTGAVRGVEALARWHHPERGLLTPASFLPQLEGTPLMAELTQTIVTQSLRWLAEWQQVMPTLRLSLNLSADELARPDAVERLQALVQQHGVPPRSLVWEVTETLRLGGTALANVARLRLKGFGLAMDDYGVGYSSLHNLSRSPFTELKVDRCFVDGATSRPHRRAILASSLKMGRQLGITTVAEGVQTPADWQLLGLLGCDLAQGWLLAAPMPATSLLGWMRSERARLRALAAGEPSG